MLKDQVQIYPELSRTQSTIQGILASARYDIVPDIQFGYTLPQYIWPNEEFDIELNYTNYNRTQDWSGQCNITIGDTTYSNFAGLSLPLGTYDYTINCPSTTASGDITVDSFYIQPVNHKRFERFNLTIVKQGNPMCAGCSLTINGTPLALSGCQATAQLSEFSYNATATCGDESRQRLFVLQDARQVWDEGEVLGMFTVGPLPGVYLVTSNTSVFTNAILNGAYNWYEIPNQFMNYGREPENPHKADLFCYVGKIGNDEIKITN